KRKKYLTSNISNRFNIKDLKQGDTFWRVLFNASLEGIICKIKKYIDGPILNAIMQYNSYTGDLVVIERKPEDIKSCLRILPAD
ncbi:hypothetical protein CWI37_0703p0010, partial [Hamiltosporidium tvaerminnensis]